LVLAYRLGQLARGITDRAAGKQPHRTVGEGITEPAHEVLRRIEPMTHIDSAADDHRVITAGATDVPGRDHRDDEALPGKFRRDRLRDLGS
jgi:hypothetical protein